MLTKRPLLYISLATALVTTFICPFSAHSDDFYPAKVKDISDRAYEPAVIDILDNAKESIVISMYVMTPAEKGPVALLMNDLIEALDRGVSVELYLNTRFGRSEDIHTLDEKPFKRLQEKGAEIYPISRKYTLHDKLIIVDSRYVVEGSHNWSIRALKQNHESSTLIDSPALAREKLSRVRNFILEKDRLAEQNRLEELRNPPPLPENTTINLPKALIEDKNLLPGMFSRQDKRAFNAYFVLVLRGYTVGRGELPEEFPVSAEELADDLEVPVFPSGKEHRWDKVSEILRKLQDDYGLIDIDFRYGTEEWVHIKELPGDTFPVRVDFFEARNLNARSTRTKFIYLIQALLREEGSSLDSSTKEELSERFHIHPESLRRGIKELE